VRLLLDEHLSQAIAEELRRRGHDVITAVEAGLQYQSDEAVLASAVRDHRAVATVNYQDFRPLHHLYLSRGERHFGLVLIPRRFSLGASGFGRLIDAVEGFWANRPEETGLD